MSASYDELRSRLREAAALDAVVNLLSWDQETMMPPKAAGFRAEELALVARLAHERRTDARIDELLATCQSDAELTADEATAANLREARRDYDRARKLPSELVAEIHDTASRAVEAWKSARQANRYDDLAPWLARQVELNRRKAECYGTPDGGEPYDALIQDFEPDMTSTELERIFAPLRAELSPLIADIGASPRRTDTAVLELRLPVERQVAFNREVLARLGFDTEAGRLDVSAHPFSSGVGPGDTRLTTRYRADGFPDALSSTLHEAGHAMYEQGLPKEELLGQPLAESLGLGVHESQSRLWENHVGRSRAFWTWALPEAQAAFGESLDRFSAEDLYRAVNTVRPNLIRVESDEATYNLHIMLRFDLERAMVRGDLDVRDLPGAWNERIRQDLELDVPDDARGCMQDIHWPMGSFGYFPTYTLGNLYAAQLWTAISADLPDLEDGISRGEFGDLLGWLRRNVHTHGRRYRVADLCTRLTGRPVDHTALMAHLNTKLRKIYGV